MIFYLTQALADDVRRIMKGLGFTVEILGTGNDDVYYKKPLCNFEMHQELFSLAFNERSSIEGESA